jgi:hypothetical protein
MLLNAHLTNSGNVGDEFCSPWHYFDQISVRQSMTDPVEEDHVIYGGGAIAAGVIANTPRNKKVVLWGVGATQRRRFDKPIHPNYPDNVLLAGIRDYHLENAPKNYEWVPCVSCLHPIFDVKFDVTKEVAYFGHAKLHPLSEINNNHMSFEDVISNIATAEIVVTTSYHGAYWATLLGKKVICDPFGSKFYGLKHKPRFMKLDNLTRFNIFQIENHPYPDALEECRQINRDFYKKVLQLLS